MFRMFRLSYFRPSNVLTHINQTFRNANGVEELFLLFFFSYKDKYQCCLGVFPAISFSSKVVSLSIPYLVYGYTLERFPSFKMEFLVKTENISPWHELRKRKCKQFSAINNYKRQQMNKALLLPFPISKKSSLLLLLREYPRYTGPGQWLSPWGVEEVATDASCTQSSFPAGAASPFTVPFPVEKQSSTSPLEEKPSVLPLQLRGLVSASAQESSLVDVSF